jgi:hypothetical protein
VRGVKGCEVFFVLRWAELAGEVEFLFFFWGFLAVNYLNTNKPLIDC